MTKNQRSSRPHAVHRQRRTAVGLALGLAVTLLGGSVVPALALDDEPNGSSSSLIAPSTENGTEGDSTGEEIDVEWDSTTVDPEPSGPQEDPAQVEQPAPPADGVDAEEQTGADSEAEQVGPLAVPNPTASTAVITVKVGGDRAANGTVGPLAGVRLALHRAGTATGGGGGGGNANLVPAQGTAGTRYDESWSWTTCTSDADGDCSFVIPIRPSLASSTGVPQDTRFWVVQESAPEGWYSNPNVRVGSFGASPERTWQYRFRTDTLLRAGTTYASTALMPWNATAENPDRFFMRNRISNNVEDWYAANVGRTTGVWNTSRNNPDMIGGCPIDIAIIADTSGSLGETGIASLKSTMSAFADAFRGTNARMAALSFSAVSPGMDASNHPTLMPVTTAAQANAFKAQYAGWAARGGTNWDAAFATAANVAPHYDVAILLTDGNPTVMRNNPIVGSSAFNTMQDVDAGIFSANQLKAQGTRVLGLGVGPAFTPASEHNLRAVSGPTKGVDYFRVDTFDQATQVLVNLAKERCTGSIGVQKLIVPEGGTIQDATPAPAGWEFGAVAPAGGATVTPASQTTVAGGEGKVEFGLAYDPGATSAGVQIHEVQQEGYQLLQADGKNAVCVNRNTGAAVSVSNAGDEARPAFDLTARENERIECKVYNQPSAPGAIEVQKSSDPESGTEVSPGQEVTYTLTFENSGGQPAVVAYDDVLTGVLDDADLVSGPTAQAPLVAGYNDGNRRINISGNLGAGETRAVTYTVRVKDPLPASADGKLGNFVVKTGEEPPTECEPDDPLCTEHPVTGSLSWNKVDASDTSNLLGGSTWKLTPYGEDGELIPSEAMTIEDCVAASAANCNGPDQDPAKGKFLLSGLPPGLYSLEETEAPAGYQLLDEPIDVVINTNLAFGDIENIQSEVPQLPLTGGMGTLAIFLGAGAAGLLVLMALMLQRHRSRTSSIS